MTIQESDANRTRAGMMDERFGIRFVFDGFNRGDRLGIDENRKAIGHHLIEMIGGESCHSRSEFEHLHFFGGGGNQRERRRMANRYPEARMHKARAISLMVCMVVMLVEIIERAGR